VLLHFDIETRSEVDLKTVGLRHYSRHPSSQILMLAYAFGDGEVLQWQPHLGPMPNDLHEALHDPKITKVMWNVGFERAWLDSRLGIQIPLRNCFDPMAHARYLGFPGALDICGRVMGLGALGKSKDGRRLIKMFTTVSRATKRFPRRFKDWDSHPQEWQQFLDYNKQDVIAEREVKRRLDEIGEFPVEEYRVWLFDQIVNERGIPVDETFVARARDLVEGESARILAEIKKITGVANPVSMPQMKKWFESQGYPMKSLAVLPALEALCDEKLPAPAREVLELRRVLGGSATKKLPAIQARVYEGRLHGEFVYHKAHTGRWAGAGVNCQNIKRPLPAVKKATDKIVTGLLNGGVDFKGLGLTVSEAIGGVLRASFRPQDGVFFASDLSQIENRVLAWYAECPNMLKIYAEGRCAYRSTAVSMFGVPYEEVTDDQRQKAKPIVLGGGFGMFAKKMQASAKSMGVILTFEECERYLEAFHAAYPEISIFWERLGACAMQATQEFCRLRLGKLLIDGSQPEILRIFLPSGRALHYVRPYVGVDDWGRAVFVYEGMKGGWSVLQARGSHLVENVCQASARDVLVHGMMAAHRAGFKIVHHCHDEMTAEVPRGSALTLPQFDACLVENLPPWTAGLPVAAEGFECAYYRKN
jgi:DNA polymerase